MTAVTVKLDAICSGGNHLTFGVTGDATATVHGVLENMLEPITDEEKVAFVKVLAKMAKAGRTLAQARAILEAGVTVTV